MSGEGLEMKDNNKVDLTQSGKEILVSPSIDIQNPTRRETKESSPIPNPCLPSRIRSLDGGPKRSKALKKRTIPI